MDSDEERNFLDSVERGWRELHSGPGEIVDGNDDFFKSIIKEIENEDCGSDSQFAPQSASNNDPPEFLTTYYYD